jgi:hypothetical protein
MTNTKIVKTVTTRDNARTNERRRERRRLARERRREVTRSSTAKTVGTQGRVDGVLSDCCLRYAAAIADPFGAPTGACIPDAIQTDSFKCKVFHKGTFTIGTAGHGFVALNHRAACVSDLPCLAKTDATFTGVYFQATTATTGVLVESSNSLFVTTQFGTDVNEVRYRPVAAGLRIRYRGTELDLAGHAYGIGGGPSVGTIVGHGPTLFGYDAVEQIAITSARRWIRIIRPPLQDSSETTYQDGFRSAATNDIGNPGMGIMVAGATPGESFDYEFVVHYEYIGAIPGTSPSDYDPTGFAGVVSVAARPAYIAARDDAIYAGPSSAKEFIKLVLVWITEGVSGAWRVVGPEVINAAKIATMEHLRLMLEQL